MQVDAQIFVEGDTLQVELPFVHLIYDLREVQVKAYKFFDDQFEHAHKFDRINDENIIDFMYLNFDERYDILHDLTYYYGVKATNIIQLKDKS